MRRTRLISASLTLSLIAACADAAVLGPSSPEPVQQTGAADASAAAARQVETSGEFLAQVDFATISFTPRGQNCLLTVDGQLVFTGTIQGTATGTTEALVFAPCEEAMTTPPGTYPDVFKSELEFAGTIDGEAATADLLYMGRVQPGGTIEGRLIFSNGVSGRLETDGFVAVGGSYHGSVVVH